MSLATRCPACHTVFRVVQDQLRVSEGWVRCGHCQEVFNALESLFDLDAAGSAAATRTLSPAATLPAAPAPAPVTPGEPSPPSGPAEAADAALTPVPDAPAPDPEDEDALAEALARELAAAASDDWSSPPPGPRVRLTWPELPPPAAPGLPARDRAGAQPDATADATADTAADTAADAAADAASVPVDAAQAASDPAPRADVVSGAAPEGEHGEHGDQGADAPAGARGESPGEAFDDPLDAAPDAAPAAGTDVPPAASRPAAHGDEANADDDEPTPSRFMGPTPAWAADGRGKRVRRARRVSADAPTDAKAAPPASAPAHDTPAGRRRQRHSRRHQAPRFVRQAEREAAWQRPAVRAGLVLAGLLLAATLAAQLAYRERDLLAARLPASAPLLARACEALGCRLRAPLALEPLRLEASDLVRTPREQVLRLTADLHNTAAYAVRTPALEVSFTDASGRLLARRVFGPRELGSRDDAIAARATWRIDAQLGVGELPVAGYTVEVFYP